MTVGSAPLPIVQAWQMSAQSTGHRMPMESSGLALQLQLGLEIQCTYSRLVLKLIILCANDVSNPMALGSKRFPIHGEGYCGS